MNLVKRIGMGVLVGMTAISSIVPVFAKEVDMHMWAYEDLYEGSYFGIVDEAWLNQLQGTVSGEELIALLDAVEAKLATIDGVKLKEGEQALEVSEGPVSREEVVGAIFSILNCYEYPNAIGLENVSMLDFMKGNGILKGDTTGFHLEDTCTKEGAMAFAIRTVQYVFDTLDAGGKGFFWKVEKGDNEVYLLGSIHLASTDIYPFSEEIRDAYDQADGIYVEANTFDQEGMQKFLEYATYQDGTTLKDHLPEDLYNKSVDLAATYGLKEEQLQYYKPWYLTNYFTVMGGSDTGDLETAQEAAAVGIDNYFILDALTFGKPLYELEGYEYQAKMFDSYSEGLQNYLLEGNIEALGSGHEDNAVQESVETWLKNWREGDLEGFKKTYSLESDLPEAEGEEVEYLNEYIEKMLTNRNKEMADQVVEMLNKEGENSYLMVVGAGHYLDDTGIIALLEKEGYKVTYMNK